MGYWILLTVLALLLVSLAVITYKKKCSIDYVSFEDSFVKSDLPIITLYNDCYALNFLIDTGSTFSCIDSNILKYLHYTNTNAIREVVSVNGVSNSPVIYMTINDTEDAADELFTVVDMDNSNSVNDSITIHGILGSTFCRKAGFIIDYSKLRVYSK